MNVEARLKYSRPERTLHLNRTRFVLEYRSKEQHYNCRSTLRKTCQYCVYSLSGSKPVLLADQRIMRRASRIVEMNRHAE
jgi:hypothetical protein